MNTKRPKQIISMRCTKKHLHVSLFYHSACWLTNGVGMCSVKRSRQVNGTSIGGTWERNIKKSHHPSREAKMILIRALNSTFLQIHNTFHTLCHTFWNFRFIKHFALRLANTARWNRVHHCMHATFIAQRQPAKSYRKSKFSLVSFEMNSYTLELILLQTYFLCSDGLKLGNSKHWSEVLKIMTGESDMSADAILEYFKPLHDFLIEENKKSRRRLANKQ